MLRPFALVLLTASVFFVDPSAHAKILNLDPPVQIHNDPKSGITISSFQLTISSEKISGATYTIKNVSGKPLIAFATGIDIYWDSADGKPCHGGNSEDAWFLNGTILEPGEEETVQFSKVITPDKPTHIVRLAVNLDYAEFADGSRVGRNSETIAKTFDDNRKAKLAVQQEYANLFRGGLSPEALSKKITSDLLSETTNTPRRTAIQQLQIAWQTSGPKVFTAKLTEPPRVPVN